MRQTDVQNIWYMQMPRWLLSDSSYSGLSLDVKATYTFLLSRFQLLRQGDAKQIYPAHVTPIGDAD